MTMMSQRVADYPIAEIDNELTDEDIARVVGGVVGVAPGVAITRPMNAGVVEKRPDFYTGSSDRGGVHW